MIAPERVLLVKLAALGDVIMASTLVPAIRARWPTTELTWVVGRGAAPLVRGFEGVDQVIELDEQALFRRGRVAAAWAVLSAWRSIGRGRELALIAHTDPRYALLVRAAGASVVRRFADEFAPRPGVWHGTEYARLLEDATWAPSSAQPMGASRTDRAPPPFAALRPLLLPDPVHVPGSGPLVLVAPGGGRNFMRDDLLRRWPIASWERVTAALIAAGYRVAAVGVASDAAECARCAALGAVDLSGRLSILDLLALMQEAQVVVTHDSGTLHMSMLMRRPTVALFGPTPPGGRVPPGALVTVLSSAAGLACAPCYDGFSYAPCSANRCLSGVDDLTVVEAVRRLAPG